MFNRWTEIFKIRKFHMRTDVIKKSIYLKKESFSSQKLLKYTIH